MNKRQLKKKLKEKGASFIRQGGGHEVWLSKNGYMFTVPRHNEILERTAKDILKQADK